MPVTTLLARIGSSTAISSETPVSDGIREKDGKRVNDGFPEKLDGDDATSGLAYMACDNVSCCFRSYCASSFRVAVTVCVTLLISSNAVLQSTQYRCAIPWIDRLIEAIAMADEEVV